MAKSRQEIFTWKEPQMLLLTYFYNTNEFKLSDLNYTKKHIWQAIGNEIHKRDSFPHLHSVREGGRQSTFEKSESSLNCISCC